MQPRQSMPAWAAALFLLLVLPAQAQYLPARPFSHNLQHWQKAGEAQFSAVQFQGKTAALIVVPPAAPLQYQQLQFDVHAGFSAGDVMQADALVRTKSVHDGVGAYMVLEWLDSTGRRIGLNTSYVSRSNGAEGFTLLQAEGQAPQGAASFRMSLILHAHASAWFEQPRLKRIFHWSARPLPPGTLRRIQAYPSKPVQRRFTGFGYDVWTDQLSSSAEKMRTVFYPRWRELNPAFARVHLGAAWNRPELNSMAKALLQMKRTNTSVFATTFHPPALGSSAAIAAYARHAAWQLEYLVLKKGCTNLRWYCPANEMTLSSWGYYLDHLPQYKALNAALYRALAAKHVPVGILGPDASPLSNWSVLPWVMQHMNGLLAGYDVHHYVNSTTPSDPLFAPWFQSEVSKYAGMAARYGKPFMLTEFGSKGDGRVVNGVTLDRCVYFGTPQEPETGTQLADVALAAINGGAGALAYWTFADFPPHPGWLNQWGLFRNRPHNTSRRAPYYACGILSRALRGPAEVCRVRLNDAWMRAVVLRRSSASWEIVVLNRNPFAVHFSLRIAGLRSVLPLSRSAYNPANIRKAQDGGLPPPGSALLVNGKLQGVLAPQSFAVYSSGLPALPHPPAAAWLQKDPQGRPEICWQAPSGTRAAFYRIYLGGREAGITSSLRFVLPPHASGHSCSVAAVDFWGRTSRQVRASGSQPANATLEKG